MWQYYKACFINNEWNVKVIRPDGRKLMEHSYYWNRSMKLIEKILFQNAYNVFRIGDYSSMQSFVWKHEFENEIEINYDSEFQDSDFLHRNVDRDYYLVNKSAKEFINMTKQEMKKNLQDEFGRIVHPLPLLCKAPTEDAWWDYHSDVWREFIGRRCGDIITIYCWMWELWKALEDIWYTDMTEKLFFKE